MMNLMARTIAGTNRHILIKHRHQLGFLSVGACRHNLPPHRKIVLYFKLGAETMHAQKRLRVTLT